MKMKILIATSLLINVLVIGILVGQRLPMWHHAWPKDTVMTSLTIEEQHLIKSHIQALHKENRQIKKAIRKQRKEVIQILSAPEFDSQSFMNKTQEIHDLRGKMMQNMNNTALALAKELPPEKRGVILKLLKPRPGRF